MLENGQEECNCPKKKCVRHGNCEECMSKHGEKKTFSFCKREKKKKIK